MQEELENYDPLVKNFKHYKPLKPADDQVIEVEDGSDNEGEDQGIAARTKSRK